MTNRLPSFDKNGQEGAVLRDAQSSIDAKLQKLQNLQPCMLDVSIREPTAYSSWSHRLSDKMDILKLVREFGFQDIMLGEFKPWDTVDEQFCKQLSDAEKDGCFAFSPIGSVKDGAIDLDNSIPLQKAAALAPNVLFEFFIEKATTEEQVEQILERFDLCVEWIRNAWKERGIEHDGRNGRIYVNIPDTFESFYNNTDIYVRVIKYIGAHPHLDAILFEDELGTSFHFQVGELTKLIRSLVPPPKKILAHLHENSGTMYASALEVVINGADGLWAGFAPIGGMMYNAASSVFLANLMRIGNQNVEAQFQMNTTIPLVRKLDRINQPSPTDYLHPIIGEGAYLSTLRAFEQHQGGPMALPPEAIGAKRGFRVVPAIANNYAMSHRLDELGITYPSQPSTTVPGEKELQYEIFRTMWDLMQQSLIAGRKVDCNEESVLREYLDRARQIHSQGIPKNLIDNSTPTPPPSGSPIEFEPSLTFDGKGDYVEVLSYPHPTEAITVSCWAKSNTATWNTAGCLISQRNAYILHPNANNKLLHFYIFSGGHWRATAINPNIEITEWHHYAGTCDGHSIRIYIDGEEVARANYSGTIDADKGSLFIGWDDGLAGRYFDGKITEVRIWDYARREQNIKGDMNYRLSGNESGLVGYWPLTGDASDKTSNGKHGEINGATYV